MNWLLDCIGKTRTLAASPMALARDFRQRSLGEGLGKAANVVNWDDLPGVANHGQPLKYPKMLCSLVL